MELHEEMGSRNIKEAIAANPWIGEILEKHGIGCTRCSVGTCLVKDVVAVHFLGAETEALIEKEINSFFDGKIADDPGQDPAP